MNRLTMTINAIIDKGNYCILNGTYNGQSRTVLAKKDISFVIGDTISYDMKLVNRNGITFKIAHNISFKRMIIDKI